MIIFCGHFPDGAMHFTEEEIEDETRAEWYLRQMLGSANFEGGPLLHIASGNLGYQIEHHLFPDLPSNRYAEISDKVRPLARSTASPTPRGRCTSSTARRCARSRSCRCRTGSPSPTDATARSPRRFPAVGEGRPSARCAVPRREYWSRGLGMIDMPAGGIGGDPVRQHGRPRAGQAQVTQCALSRICGVCGESLERPVAFLGSEAEADRKAFHFPPAHVACAEPAWRSGARRRARLSATTSPPTAWVLVTTSGFEFVRPTPEWVDRRPCSARTR